MKFELKILGCSAAVPTPLRFTAAQVLTVRDTLYLIDCGEGVQIRMQQFDVRKGKINQIFISHLHGDHFYGLLGLLNSFALNDRKNALTIFSPKGLKEFVEAAFAISGGKMPYPLDFIELDTQIFYKIFEDETVEVFAIPLQHRIPTCGFLFKEKALERNIIPEKIKTYNIPFPQILAIKQGADFETADGKIIPNEELTLPLVKERSFAYCSDTQFAPEIVPYIYGVDLLFHETTFCDDLIENAQLGMHSTSSQAAQIAKMAEVNTLVTGHYSTRYENGSEILAEAEKIFSNVLEGIDGKTYEIPFISRKKRI